MNDTPKNKPGLKPGSTVVRHDGVKKIQALAMMREVALGKSVADVAKQFNVTPTIVRARMSYAQRAGLFVHHEDVILSSMVPRAEGLLLTVLDPNTVVDPALKVKVALEVMKGTGLFRKPGTTAPAALQGASGKAKQTLEDYINQLRSSGDIPGESIDVEYGELGELAPGEDTRSGAGAQQAAIEGGHDQGVDDTHGEAPAPAGEGTRPADLSLGHGIARNATEQLAAAQHGLGATGGEDHGIAQLPPVVPTGRDE